MPQINNPYTQEKFNKVIELERVEKEPKKDLEKIQNLKTEINELETKSRAFLQEKICEFKGKINELDQKREEIKEDYPSLSRQYKELCTIYKDVMQLVDKVRDSKKMIREEIEKTRRMKK